MAYLRVHRWHAGEPTRDALYREAKISSRDDTNSELVAKLGQLPLMYQPGSPWEAGVSTDVLGRLVGVLSGQSLGEFFEAHIFRPLDMQETAFHVPAVKLARAALAASRRATDEVPIRHGYRPKIQSGDCGSYSNGR